MEETERSVLLFQGAESKIFTTNFLEKVVLVKERFTKTYRNPQLDSFLTKERIKAECRNILRCKQAGVKTPAIYKIDLKKGQIYMEYFSKGITVKSHIQSVGGVSNCNEDLPQKIGLTLATIHSNNIVHGDLTTSNMILNNDELIMIDFGLSQSGVSAEDKAVDLYVLERALLSTHADTEEFFEQICQAYASNYGKGAEEVLHKFKDVRARGRKRTMVG